MAASRWWIAVGLVFAGCAGAPARSVEEEPLPAPETADDAPIGEVAVFERVGAWTPCTSAPGRVAQYVQRAGDAMIVIHERGDDDESQLAVVRFRRIEQRQEHVRTCTGSARLEVNAEVLEARPARDPAELDAIRAAMER